MSPGPTLALLYEAANGSTPPPELLTRLVAEYDEAAFLCEVADTTGVTAIFAEMVTVLLGRRDAVGTIDGVSVNVLTEFFPCLPRLMECDYLDYGEWALLTLPAIGWSLELSREGDRYRVVPAPAR
jgi:hypothetical protein